MWISNSRRVSIDSLECSQEHGNVQETNITKACLGSFMYFHRSLHSVCRFTDFVNITAVQTLHLIYLACKTREGLRTPITRWPQVTSADCSWQKVQNFLRHSQSHLTFTDHYSNMGEFTFCVVSVWKICWVCAVSCLPSQGTGEEGLSQVISAIWTKPCENVPGGQRTH